MRRQWSSSPGRVRAPVLARGLGGPARTHPQPELEVRLDRIGLDDHRVGPRQQLPEPAVERPDRVAAGRVGQRRREEITPSHRGLADGLRPERPEHLRGGAAPAMREVASPQRARRRQAERRTELALDAWALVGDAPREEGPATETSATHSDTAKNSPRRVQPSNPTAEVVDPGELRVRPRQADREVEPEQRRPQGAGGHVHSLDQLAVASDQPRRVHHVLVAPQLGGGNHALRGRRTPVRVRNPSRQAHDRRGPDTSPGERWSHRHRRSARRGRAALLATHLTFARAPTPPEDAHAMDVDGCSTRR